MSMRALLLAVQTRLQSALSGTSTTIGVEFDGSLPPFSGESFIAIHPGEFNNSTKESLDEKYSVNVTLTRRIGYAPTDKLGSEIVTKVSTGAYAVIESIRAALHMDYTTMNTANTTIGGTENGFIEPLIFQSCSPPLEVGPDWFNGVEGAGGLVWLLSFGDARRVQVIEEQS